MYDRQRLAPVLQSGANAGHVVGVALAELVHLLRDFVQHHASPCISLPSIPMHLPALLSLLSMLR